MHINLSAIPIARHLRQLRTLSMSVLEIFHRLAQSCSKLDCQAQQLVIAIFHDINTRITQWVNIYLLMPSQHQVCSDRQYTYIRIYLIYTYIELEIKAATDTLITNKRVTQ